jgi:hypothetical protein
MAGVKLRLPRPTISEIRSPLEHVALKLKEIRPPV